jgi:Rad3-related DNA helicase
VETDLLGARRALESLCADTARALAAQRHGTIAWLRPPRTLPARPAAANAAAPGPANGAANGAPTGPGNVADPASAAPVESTEGMPALYRAPVEVGGLLTPLLAPGRALVLAGTSLAVGGEFDFTCAGLDLPTTTHVHAATPDYTARTLLLLPEDAPEPNAPAFQRHLDELIVSVASALVGRTVVIFPSHAALRAAAMGIKRTLESRDVLVLAQGMDGSARQLWQTFRTQPRVVLLGAGAFWDGVGREGDGPACVIVARLPFPSLSDPLLAARAEAWPDQQAQFVVPHAALRLRQALNGLAWGPGNAPARNAVILFDRRLSTRGYGGTVLATLPRCTQRTEALEHLAGSVAAWVDDANAPSGTGA